MTRQLVTVDTTDAAHALDAKSVLQQLGQRWSVARTLEYRSRAVLNHVGELRVATAVHVCLRRPALARFVFATDRAEVSRLRVCDGRRLWDRTADAPLRPARTESTGYMGSVTADLPHPLDELGYCIAQFFADLPFVPSSRWGEPGKSRTLTGSVVPASRSLPTKAREVFRLVFARGTTHDTLTLEPISLRPLEIVRVGEHAGTIQELLRETFETVSLGAFLPPSLFTWTPADDRGDTLTAESRRL